MILQSRPTGRDFFSFVSGFGMKYQPAHRCIRSTTGSLPAGNRRRGTGRWRVNQNLQNVTIGLIHFLRPGNRILPAARPISTLTTHSGATMTKAKRTTHRSSKGTKLYAVRDSKGRFKDIQSRRHAHEITE
jgi:hypothetical protein